MASKDHVRHLRLVSKYIHVSDPFAPCTSIVLITHDLCAIAAKSICMSICIRNNMQSIFK